ncbi:MAG TPA: hypothetical protein VIV60_35390, partial [Polyangiaceae bacterium]
MNKGLTAIALVLGTASGCADSGMGEADSGTSDVGVAAQAVVTTSSQTVAHPIARKMNGSLIVDDIDSTTNKARKAWDASYSEMLIADEYAKCVAEVAGQTIPSFITASSYPSMQASGAALNRTAEAIDRGACPSYDYSPNSTSFPPTPLEWAHRRADPNCNVDPVTGNKVAALKLPATDPNSPVTAFATDPAVPSFTITSFDTRVYGYSYLYRAYVGLCFAERVNSLLESAEVFTATTQEHMLLLGLVHERAQDAMMKLGHILKYLNRDSTGLPYNSSGGPAAGAYLRLWLGNHPTYVAPLREKFFEAVQLASSASMEFARYLERQAGARWTTDSSGSDFGRDWGIGSACNRLMNLVFGGGALGDLWGVEDYVGIPHDWFSAIREHTAEPRVQVMFNLARQADALYFQTVPDASGAAVLQQSSWEVMYLETELAMRVANCPIQDPAQCTAAAQRAQLPALTRPDDFTLKSVYGVTLEHAEKLSTMLFDAAIKHDMVNTT